MIEYSDYLNQFNEDRLIVSSSNKMSLERFNGKWIITGEFPSFSKIINDRLFGINERRDLQIDYSRNYVDIEIYPPKGNHPDPSIEQIISINYLLENQDLMLEAFLNGLKNKIYPEFKECIDDEEMWFPKLLTVDDLSKTINLTKITISILNKDGFCYTSFQCNFSADEEHGLEMYFHKNRLIEYHAIGESDGDGLVEDMGLDHKKLREELNREYEIERKKPCEYYEPHPKYGILTRMKFESNQHYPNRLLHEKRYNDLIAFLESGKVKIEDYNSGLLSTAIVNKMDSNIIDYLFESQPKHLYYLFKISAKQYNFEYLNRLLKLGYDINQDKHQPSILSEMFLEYSRNISNKIKVKQIKEVIEFLMEKGATPHVGGKYKRDTFWYVERIEKEEICSELNTYLLELCKRFNFKPKDIIVKKELSPELIAESKKVFEEFGFTFKDDEKRKRNTTSNFLNSIFSFFRRWRK